MQEFLKNINLYDSGGNSGKKIAGMVGIPATSMERSGTVTNFC
jgi:hypothetical protein